MINDTLLDSLSISWRMALLQVAMLVSTMFSSLATDVSCVALALWAMRGPLASIQVLALFVAIRGMNPMLIHWGSVSTTLTWALPLIVSLRVLPLIRRSDFRIIGPMWIFCAVAVFCSIAGSLALAVSIMKAVSLGFIVAAVVVASLRLTKSEVRALGMWLRSLAFVVATLSLVSFIRPDIAHYPDTNLLQGILDQPQALGAFLAPFSAAFVANWLWKAERSNSIGLAVMVVIVLCMVLTLSRTAAIAALLGTAMALIGGRSSTIDAGGKVSTRVLLLVAFCIIAGVGAELVGGGVSAAVSGFVLKRGETEVSDAFLASRGGGMISELQNFLRSPIVGNGFGVYPDGQFPVPVVDFHGIPVSAPVEKGVLPSAVLEETGLLGFIAFSYLIYSMIKPLWHRVSPSVSALLFGCLFINLGEAILLSAGNIGLYTWLLIGWCLRVAMEHESADGAPSEVPESQPIQRPFLNLLN